MKYFRGMSTIIIAKNTNENDTCGIIYILFSLINLFRFFGMRVCVLSSYVFPIEYFNSILAIFLYLKLYLSEYWHL